MTDNLEINVCKKCDKPYVKVNIQELTLDVLNFADWLCDQNGLNFDKEWDKFTNAK
jgi:NTP pyrophosphatase (non-canonical NTP hydrolase)